jgi:hypothetical protein
MSIPIPLNRVQRLILCFAGLLLIGGLLSAQERNSGDWGAAVDGLQIRLSVDRAALEQSKIPKFTVELRNAGDKDLLLNLGTRSHDGGRQYLTAVSLILEDGDGRSQWLELKRTAQASGAGFEALSLPLPVGASFSFTADLYDYSATNSKGSDYKLKPGSYLVAAHLNGFATDNRETYALGPGRIILTSGVGQPPAVFVRAFDDVNPESPLGPPPISNALRIEIQSR